MFYLLGIIYIYIPGKSTTIKIIVPNFGWFKQYCYWKIVVTETFIRIWNRLQRVVKYRNLQKERWWHLDFLPPLPSTHVWCLVSYHFFIGHVSGMSRSIDSSIHHPFITFVIPLWNHDLSWWRCRRWSYFLHKHKRCFFMCFRVIDHFSSFFWKCWREMSQISLWYMGVSKNSGTPKWMVYNGKPNQNGWFGGKTHHLRKHPYIYIYTVYIFF